MADHRHRSWRAVSLGAAIVVAVERYHLTAIACDHRNEKIRLGQHGCIAEFVLVLDVVAVTGALPLAL